MVSDESSHVFRERIRSSNFDQNMLQAELDELNTCLCCDRHLLNRPSRIDSIITVFDPEADHTTDTSCKCCCRQKARTLCRLCLN